MSCPTDLALSLRRTVVWFDSTVGRLLVVGGKVYREKPDHGFDWIMLVMLALLAVAMIVQQVALLQGIGSLVRFR